MRKNDATAAAAASPAPARKALCRPSTNSCGEPLPIPAADGMSAPRPAMPTAMPAWRNVSLTPAARPLCSCGAEPRATAMTDGLNRPTPKSGDQLAGQDDGPRRAGARQREQDHADGDESEADRDHDPVRDLLADLAARAGDDEVEDRAGQVDEAGLDGRKPEHLLQVERRVEEDREERRRDPEGRDLRARERRVAEEPQREHRVRRARLDDQEGDERQGGAGELGDDLRAAPADLVAAQQREHE